ncbi:MAG: PVC-type heme-binding CxxCH protein [Planctomycetia bacterium]
MFQSEKMWYSLGCVLICLMCDLRADERIPHAQDKPPGPALSPEEAMAKMTVPEGFSVELIAAEPDLVNPVSMAIDERGRYWITESLEYPRRPAGPGRDRVKVLEDTDGDGRADRFDVFMEGLNIPSGIAVGHGGVWIANAPDLLFVQDTDGDGKADRQDVVVSGFGRDDTHELPNSLTWGPDGWLYGLNGVFNPSHIHYGPSNPNFREGHAGWKFTCAMFRIHPKTWEFQVFCEGTSNPWGIAFNDVGEAFVSACVIDHLWHLTETGYYHRQGGPYPPFTWKIESIVSHKHQKAAYCGIHWYDSDAYPEAFRKKLYMGNIHGSCINSDRIERRESTWQASPEPDFLSANDAWFMPVVQKTGPDGCLCILDWYDRYHCYQDANRDPSGVDRLRGRLYRIHYRDVPRVAPFDLAQETDESLLRMLGDGNSYRRETAQRLLTERLLRASAKSLLETLEKTVLTAAAAEVRLRVLGILMAGGEMSEQTQLTLLNDADPVIRAWAIRAAGDRKGLSPALLKSLLAGSTDADPAVRLQSAITAVKQPEIDEIPVLVSVLAAAGNDPLAPRIVWKNLHPLLETQTAQFVAEVKKNGNSESGFALSVLNLLPRVADRLLSAAKPDTDSVALLLELLLANEAGDEAADRCLQLLTARLRSGEIQGLSLVSLRERMATSLLALSSKSPERAGSISALELAASMGIPAATANAEKQFHESRVEGVRIRMLNALVTAGWDRSLELAETLLMTESSEDAKRGALQAIARIRSNAAGELILRSLKTLSNELQPLGVEILTDRLESSIALMTMIQDGHYNASIINANQARKMLQLKDDALTAMVHKSWGLVRTERDPARQELIGLMRNQLRTSKGDPHAGRLVFRRVCGQCHKMYGEGADVGPDITRNGRASFEQLLSNVFDPSLVIGSAYQAQTVVTTNGKVLTGLPIEDSPQRVVLKVQGDRQEVIPRADIEEQVTSPLSLMPEGLEKQLGPQELLDLFAWLTLDRPPEDSEARYLPGSRILPGKTDNPQESAPLVEQLLPGFVLKKSGEGGIEVLENYHGRPALRTHPVSQREASQMTATMLVPAGKTVQLRLAVASDERGDWQLRVNIDGQPRHQSIVRHGAGGVEWGEVVVDVSDLSGRLITIDLFNGSNDWSYEFGYWNAAELIIR